MHIGVITSSLGSRGGTVCTGVGGDDRAQLLPSVRPGLNSYNGTGILKWDPDVTATPAGEPDLGVLADDLSQQIAAAGAVGCGYEHSLEAWYQFLIEPLPTTNITNVAFGGAELSTLFITGATSELTPEQHAAEPLAGALFAVDTDAIGCAPHRYAG